MADLRSRTAAVLAKHHRGRAGNNPSSAACPGIDIVQIPLDDPASASYLRFEPAGRSCHDTGVILGDAMKAACAGGNGFTTWSLDPADGGSLENPAQLYSTVVPASPSGTRQASPGTARSTSACTGVNDGRLACTTEC